MVNDVQRANMMLDMLLGKVGRAVWLAINVDGKSVAEVAREHKLDRTRVQEIVASSNFAIEEARLVAERSELPAVRTAWDGFHQEDEVT